MHGDEEAFDDLVERIGDSLYSVARRILRDTTLAQDATQQALLDAWRHLPQLREPDRFEAWTHRLLVHACYAEARRERRHRGNLRLLPDDGRAFRTPASRIATQDQLDRAFRRLSVEHRTVVVLVHYLGLQPDRGCRTDGDARRHGSLSAALRTPTARVGDRSRPAADHHARHGMTAHDPFINQLEDYLDEYEGNTPLPEAVRDAIRAELPSTTSAPGLVAGAEVPRNEQRLRSSASRLRPS